MDGFDRGRRRRRSFEEGDLIVDAAIVIPKLLTGHEIADAEEEGLGLQLGEVGQLQGEAKAIIAVVEVTSHVDIVLGRHLGRRLPVIEREAGDDGLLKGEIGHGDDADEILSIGGQSDPFHPHGPATSTDGLGGEVGEIHLPPDRSWGGGVVVGPTGTGVVLDVEGVTRIGVIGLDGRGAGADGQGSIDLQEVSNVFQVSVKVYGLGVGGRAGHARGSSSARGRPQGRFDELARLLAHHVGSLGRGPIRLIALLLGRGRARTGIR